MKFRFISSLVILLLGFLTVLAPYYVFPVCEVTARPMKCFWMARAVIGQGMIIMFAGVVLAFSSSSGVRLSVSLMLLPVSLVTALLPTWLIGVCTSETMPCRMGTLPALCLLGLFTALSAVAIAWKAWGGVKKHSRSA